eukprot:3605449-Rhodomonas_salina.7
MLLCACYGKSGTELWNVLRLLGTRKAEALHRAASDGHCAGKDSVCHPGTAPLVGICFAVCGCAAVRICNGN